MLAVHLAASRCGQAGKSPQTAKQGTEATDCQEEPTDDGDEPSRELPTDEEDIPSRRRRRESSGEEAAATACKRSRKQAAPSKEREHPAGQEEAHSGTAECPTCGKVIRHKRNLSTHILSQHIGSMSKVHWHCPICRKKTFKSAASLRDHTSRKHKCYGAPRGPVAGPQATTAEPPGPAHNSDQDWPTEDILSDLSEAGETKAIPGSPSPARSQGPKKVTFGATLVAESQVEGSPCAATARGRARLQVTRADRRRPQNRDRGGAVEDL